MKQQAYYPTDLRLIAANTAQEHNLIPVTGKIPDYWITPSSPATQGATVLCVRGVSTIDGQAHTVRVPL